jgi:hypothetical protein
MGALLWEVDPQRRLTILRLDGDLPGEEVRERIEGFWGAHPESISNHCVVDMRTYVGNLSYDDLSAISRRWHKLSQGRDAGCGTAIVTNDRFAKLLMNVVSLLFHSRRFALFADVDEALRWIETI